MDDSWNHKLLIPCSTSVILRLHELTFSSDKLFVCSNLSVVTGQPCQPLVSFVQLTKDPSASIVYWIIVCQPTNVDCHLSNEQCQLVWLDHYTLNSNFLSVLSNIVMLRMVVLSWFGLITVAKIFYKELQSVCYWSFFYSSTVTFAVYVKDFEL